MRRHSNAKHVLACATAAFGLAAMALAASPAQAQDPAGCYYDYQSLTDDDLLWGKQPELYCPYGYGPGMPYGAAPRGQAVAPRAQRERQSDRTRQRRARE